MIVDSSYVFLIKWEESYLIIAVFFLRWFSIHNSWKRRAKSSKRRRSGPNFNMGKVSRTLWSWSGAQLYFKERGQKNKKRMEVSSSVALLRLVSRGDDLASGPLLTSVIFCCYCALMYAMITIISDRSCRLAAQERAKLRKMVL
jgi:hypothetical protein